MRWGFRDVLCVGLSWMSTALFLMLPFIAAHAVVWVRRLSGLLKQCRVGSRAGSTGRKFRAIICWLFRSGYEPVWNVEIKLFSTFPSKLFVRSACRRCRRLSLLSPMLLDRYRAAARNLYCRHRRCRSISDARRMSRILSIS